MAGRHFIAVLVLLLIGTAIYGWRPWDMSADHYTRLAVAVIGVVGTIATILGALELWNLRHRADLDREQAAEHRRQLRMLLALRAELILNLKAQAETFTGERGAAFRALYQTAIREAATSGRGSAKWPRVILSATNDVYDQVKTALSDLPASVLPEVISYYQNDEYVAQVLMAYNDGRLDGLNATRQTAAVEQLFRIGADTTLAALDAVEAITDAVAHHPARRNFSSTDLDLTENLQSTLTSLRPIVENLRMDDAANHAVRKRGSVRKKVLAKATREPGRSHPARFFRRSRWEGRTA